MRIENASRFGSDRAELRSFIDRNKVCSICHRNKMAVIETRNGKETAYCSACHLKARKARLKAEIAKCIKI